MSKEWFEAADRMIAKQCEEVDIVISTALIQGPAGRKAPLLLKDNMIPNLKRGSVVVARAAGAPNPTGGFGNSSATKPGESYVTDGGVTCIGCGGLRERKRPPKDIARETALFPSSLRGSAHERHTKHLRAHRRQVR